MNILSFIHYHWLLNKLYSQTLEKPIVSVSQTRALTSHSNQNSVYKNWNKERLATSQIKIMDESVMAMSDYPSTKQRNYKR